MRIIIVKSKGFYDSKILFFAETESWTPSLQIASKLHAYWLKIILIPSKKLLYFILIIAD